MATRRMFSKQLTDTDHFLDLPVKAQALYFHLGMHADDDGFVTGPRRVARLIGADEKELKLLEKQGYLLSFPDGTVVIVHWRVNNYIRRDRYVPTMCREEAAALWLDEEERYTRRETDCPAYGIIFGDRRSTQDRIGEDRTGEDRSGEERSAQDSSGQERAEQEREGEATKTVTAADASDFRVREAISVPMRDEDALADYARIIGENPAELQLKSPFLLKQARALAEGYTQSFAHRRATPVDLRNVLRCCYRFDPERGPYYDEKDGGLLTFAFEQAANTGKAENWAYILAIVDRLRAQGITCREEAEAEELARQGGRFL